MTSKNAKISKIGKLFRLVVHCICISELIAVIILADSTLGFCIYVLIGSGKVGVAMDKYDEPYDVKLDYSILVFIVILFMIIAFVKFVAVTLFYHGLKENDVRQMKRSLMISMSILIFGWMTIITIDGCSDLVGNSLHRIRSVAIPILGYESLAAFVLYSYMKRIQLLEEQKSLQQIQQI